MRQLLVLFFIYLLACSSLSIQSKKPSYSSIKKIEELLNKKSSWSGIMLKMAMLHQQAGGPLTTLIQALYDLVDDLTVKQDQHYADFDKRTAEHQDEIKRLQNAISEAENDIATTQTYLRDVLAVIKRTLEQEISELHQDIEKTKKYIVEITDQRALEHSQFEERIIEHNDGLIAIQEALGVLSQLLDNGGEISFVQSKSMTAHLEKIQNKIKKNKSIDGALVKSLLSLAQASFANQDALKKVEALLFQVQENLENSIVKENEEEVAGEAAFEEEVKQKEREINDALYSISNKERELQATIEKIADNEAFIVERNRDLVGFNKDIETENDKYVQDTDSFNALVAQNQAEQESCQAALSVLESAEFAGYISERIYGDVLSTQAHGQGIEVNDWKV